LRKEANVELADSVRKPDFIRNLLQLFGKKDTPAHNLALRCLWIILHNNFGPTEAVLIFARPYSSYSPSNFHPYFNMIVP
jgi:hypothetical protein